MRRSVLGSVTLYYGLGVRFPSTLNAFSIAVQAFACCESCWFGTRRFAVEKKRLESECVTPYLVRFVTML